MIAAQQELSCAKQQIQNSQSTSQPLANTDAMATDSAACVAVALQQRDAAVAAEVAAVSRAQATEVCPSL